MLSKDRIDVLLEKHAGDTDGFLAAYTTEVRQQDTGLIRQIAQAVDGMRLVASYSTYGAPNWSDLDEVFAAARARLGEST